MPVPRKTVPKRLGKADGAGTSANACSDSSHGNATVQPAPRSTARREMGSVNLLVDRGMLIRLSRCDLRLRYGLPFVSELRAHHDGFHQRIETIVVRGKIAPHTIHQRFVRELQSPVERVTEQLAAKIANKLILSVIANKILQTCKA